MTDHVRGRQMLRDAAAAARAQTTEQHKLINRYRDIAAKLCNPPLRCKDPSQWHGYIPPAYDREREDGATPLNDSPVRVQLLALLEEAAERTDGERNAT